VGDVAAARAVRWDRRTVRRRLRPRAARKTRGRVRRRDRPRGHS